ncbi:MAG: hypothetical protein DUD32_06995 [Lactobacillus sp.]|jgi:hypothetical protein|nr:MAG: hypothetical protein DUD32_06995 [Lactobacillus sp.]
MDDELKKWSARFESKNGRQPTDEEFESAKKRIERNVEAQRQRQTQSNPRPAVKHDSNLSQQNPNANYASAKEANSEKQPPRHDWGFLWVLLLAALFIIGGIIAFKIGTAHGTSLW